MYPFVLLVVCVFVILSLCCVVNRRNVCSDDTFIDATIFRPEITPVVGLERISPNLGCLVTCIAALALPDASHANPVVRWLFFRGGRQYSPGFLPIGWSHGTKVRLLDANDSRCGGPRQSARGSRRRRHAFDTGGSAREKYLRGRGTQGRQGCDGYRKDNKGGEIRP